LNTTQKIGLAALIIIIIILSSVKLSVDSLKKEAERTLIEIAKLHANTFNEQITQLFNNINILTDSISQQIPNKNIHKTIFKNILEKNTYIRTVYILDEKEQVLYSSDQKYIGKSIETVNYYPKPMFESTGLLRFGKNHIGRSPFEKDDKLSYIPVSKKVRVGGDTYIVVIIINNQYFENRFLEHLVTNDKELNIIRMDGLLLYSNQTKTINKKKKLQSDLYKKALEKSMASGIEYIKSKKMISAYYVSDTYPLTISVSLDYDKNLKEWDYKTLLALLIIGTIVFTIAFIVITLLVKYRKAKNKEIEYQKEQIVNQEKIRNAYIVYENTNDAILITDKDCDVIDINKSFTVNTGYTLDEIKGLNPRFLKSGMHDDGFYEQMWFEIENNNHWHGEVVNKNKDGQLYTELLTINRVVDKEGELKNYIAVFTNITKQKEQEQQLKEQEELIFQQSKMAAMGEMLENIAHQWRQPLSVISTAATAPIMEEQFGIANAESNIDRFKLINESAQHLSKTIDDFRDFFRPDKEKKEFDVAKVIEQALKILNSKFKNRNIQVVKNLEDVSLFGYESELVQVIMNILNNARDALEQVEEDKRFIFLEVMNKNNTMVMIIRDSGNGIPHNIIDKIFEPYFTTKHQSQGTGIGLYMSEEIITKHMSGSLKVKNLQYEYEGYSLNGAEFEITIPFILR